MPTRLPVPVALAGAVVVALLTLLVPWSPSYDPWAWIVWGREVASLDLVTAEGPSWKPLPVLFTTVYSLAGDAAPALWMGTARVGGAVATVLAVALAARLGGRAAGAVTAVALLASPWWLRILALGFSEGMLVALALGAMLRHLDGRRDHALALAVGASLLRPEVWPFLGLYALYLVVREPARRRLAALLLPLVPLLWLGPELWGSGNLLRASERARSPNADSPAFAERPALAALEEAGGLVTPLIGAGAVMALILLVRRGRREGGLDRHGRATATIAAAVLCLTALVVVMTELGYAGNRRYLVLPAALACVLAGVGAGRLLEGVRKRAARGGAGHSRAVIALFTTAVVTLAVLGAGSLPRRASELRFETALASDLPHAIELAGGASTIRGCGQVYTGPYTIPAVAWQLELHLRQVRFTGLRAPGVVLRSRHVPRARALPELPPGAGFRDAGRVGEWRVLTACGALPEALKRP